MIGRGAADKGRSPVLRVGIIGAGHIAEKMVRTLNGMPDMTCLAVGSRSGDKARTFAQTWGIPRAYGSYGALLDDPDVDLVYVATPHSHHFDPTRTAIEKGKPCLVEKAFMANAAQAEAILTLARERNVFVAEAIWTRYLPAVGIIREILASGAVGRVRTVSATLSYEMTDKERILRPELCGGALLDIGVYGINFVRTYCDSPVERMVSVCTKFETGTDMSDSISFVLSDGTVAHVLTSAACQGDNVGVIAGEKANLWVDDINNPMRICVFGKHHELLAEYAVPEQITGFEYQLRACRDALLAGQIEPPQMPHAEILEVMRLMDRLREEWGVRYPMDA